MGGAAKGMIVLQITSPLFSLKEERKLRRALLEVRRVKWWGYRVIISPGVSRVRTNHPPSSPTRLNRTHTPCQKTLRAPCNRELPFGYRETHLLAPAGSTTSNYGL